MDSRISPAPHMVQIGPESAQFEENQTFLAQGPKPFLMAKPQETVQEMVVTFPHGPLRTTSCANFAALCNKMCSRQGNVGV